MGWKIDLTVMANGEIRQMSEAYVAEGRIAQYRQREIARLMRERGKEVSYVFLAACRCFA